MTLTLTRPNSTAADLLRLAALWLAAILVVQGCAAALALGAGPLHHHRQAARDTQAHAHADGERHFHDGRTSGIVLQADAAQALDEAASALAAALGLLASSGSTTATADAQPGHVLRGLAQLPLAGTAPEPLLRPPRAA
jgi:hypothetical protein